MTSLCDWSCVNSQMYPGYTELFSIVARSVEDNCHCWSASEEIWGLNDISSQAGTDYNLSASHLITNHQLDQCTTMGWSLVMGIIMTSFQSSGKELAEQVKMVAATPSWQRYPGPVFGQDICSLPKCQWSFREVKKVFGNLYPYAGTIRHVSFKLYPGGFLIFPQQPISGIRNTLSYVGFKILERRPGAAVISWQSQACRAWWWRHSASHT